jgi:hypothetical protein
MRKIFIFLFLSVSLSAFSQDILLQQNVKADTIRPAYGPNLRNYFYGYLGIGFPLYTSEQVKYIKSGSSADIDLGLRYKRRITNYLAFGLDLGLNTTSYKLKQSDPKTIPDTVVNDREKFQISTVSGSVYMRINVGRRGNYIGNYLDLGAYGGWNFQKKHKTTNENQDGEKVRLSTTRLKYIENFSYGFLARIGVNRYAITAKYRVSDIFDSSYEMPELPRLTVGIEMGLFK